MMKINQKILLPLAIVAGILSGMLEVESIYSFADIVSTIFIRLLKLVSLPIIFLSIVSTATSMEGLSEVKKLGASVIRYTLLTTVIAATVALSLYLLFSPARMEIHALGSEVAEVTKNSEGYLYYLIHSIPSNILQPFLEGNVIGVLFLALAFSLAVLAVKKEQREQMAILFQGLYAAVMQITCYIIRWMPFGIWAFITLFVRDLKAGLDMESIALYLTCIVGANLVQAFVVLPILLKIKGIAPIKTFKGMIPALTIAFFSKSSSASIPSAIRCAEKSVGVSKKVANFSFPLCTTINMNGCAAFILITFLFVSECNGVTFTLSQMIGWIFIATIAALGNAGVPMGCYFLSTAFLVSMDIPLHLMGVILPFYSMIDMLESAINVWSDSCVTVIVDKEMGEEVADVELGVGAQEEEVALV